jgi:nucleotide-binding universal stress UspA family protein
VLTEVPEDQVDEFDEPLYSIEQQSRQWDAAIGEASSDLDQTASAFATATKIDRRIEAGDVAPTIAHVAAEVGADVIVVGRSRASALRQLTHRSIATRLVHGAPCAVLVLDA